VERPRGADAVRAGNVHSVGSGSETPAQRDVLDKIAKLHECTRSTAVAIACTSWGRWQFLGATLYSETKFVGTVFEFVENELNQHLAFTEWLARHKFDPDLVLVDPSETERFAREWNGPGAVSEYLAKMARVIEQSGARV
jgi:hypothetical protein